MSEDYGLEFNSKSLALLKELSLSQSRLQERRACELSELAYRMSEDFLSFLQSGMGILEVFFVMSGGASLSESECHPDALSSSREFLTHYLSLLSGLDGALISRLLISRLSEKGINVTERDLLSGGAIPETFVYVKNAFADEAYDVFSQDFKDPRVKYCKDFKEGLSMVASGEVGYCLLPLEDSGSRIQSVQELIFKGDFRIGAVTPVFGFDGTADMIYCLACADYHYPDFSLEDDRYLELRVSRESDTALSHILTVSESFGHLVYRVNSVKLVTEDGERSYYSVLLRDGGEGFVTLLAYLLLFSEDCTPLGIYKNLE